jgi:hypothetical protein
MWNKLYGTAWKLAPILTASLPRQIWDSGLSPDFVFFFSLCLNLNPGTIQRKRKRNTLRYCTGGWQRYSFLQLLRIRSPLCLVICERTPRGWQMDTHHKSMSTSKVKSNYTFVTCTTHARCNDKVQDGTMLTPKCWTYDCGIVLWIDTQFCHLETQSLHF